MATLPTVSSWVAAQKITATKLNAIHTYVDFLYDPPRCRVYNSAGESCADGTAKLLSFDTEDYDTDTMHSAGNPSRVTANLDGDYRIEFYVKLPSATYSAIDLNLRKNAAGASGGGTSLFTHETTAGSGNAISVWHSIDLFLTSGDYVEIFCTQTSGASRTTTAGNGATGMALTWLRP